MLGVVRLPGGIGKRESAWIFTHAAKKPLIWSRASWLGAAEGRADWEVDLVLMMLRNTRPTAHTTLHRRKLHASHMRVPCRAGQQRRAQPWPCTQALPGLGNPAGRCLGMSGRPMPHNGVQGRALPAGQRNAADRSARDLILGRCFQAPRGTPQHKRTKPLHAAGWQVVQRSSYREASPGDGALYILSRAGPVEAVLCVLWCCGQGLLRHRSDNAPVLELMELS